MKRVRVWVQVFRDRSTLQLQWTDPDSGKRRTQSAETADAAEAEQARSDLEYEINNGLHHDTSRMSWETFRESFEHEYLSGCRENTRSGYKVTFDTFERLCHPQSLRAITARTLSAFVGSLRKLPGRSEGQTFKASTIAIRLEQMGAALRWAVKQGLIPKAPELPANPVPRKRPQPVPEEKVQRLLDATGKDRQLKAFLLCAWLAGLRRNEAYYLEREQTEKAPYLALDQNRIIFPAEAVKADEDQWVPLDPILRAALEELPHVGNRVFRFVTPAGDVLRPESVGGRVGHAAKAAGVRLTMRVLRRGFGCRYAADQPAQILQRLMRHSNIAITMAFYANVDKAVEEAVLGRNGERDTSDPLWRKHSK